MGKKKVAPEPPKSPPPQMSAHTLNRITPYGLSDGDNIEPITHYYSSSTYTPIDDLANIEEGGGKKGNEYTASKRV